MLLYADKLRLQGEYSLPLHKCVSYDWPSFLDIRPAVTTMFNATHSGKKAVLISYAHAMAEQVAVLGVDKELLLRKAGIPSKPPSNFFSFITMGQYEVFLREAIGLTKDPALGLHIGKGIKFGHHGTFAFAALSFPTIWHAMKVGRKFSSLVNQIIDIRLEEVGEFNVIRIETAYFSGEMYKTVIEIVMAMFCQLFKFALEGNIENLEIDFRYGKPHYFDQYQTTFEPAIRFESTANEIRIPRDLANKPLVMADPMVAERFENECDELIAKMLEPKSIPDQVREILFISKDGFPQLDDVARKINVSPRTLRRRFEENDTSFTRILEEVRLELAQRYLSTTERSIGEIAHLLGYEDQNSFSHAFKVLTGLPPTQYRKSK